jgi:type 1 glutamine amidotransferase
MYLMQNYNTDGKVHELLVLDKHPNNKKKLGHYPVAWCKDYGKGKVFYTSLGHREDVWENQRYQRHILGGIRWALGLEQGDAAPQAKPLSPVGK